MKTLFEYLKENNSIPQSKDYSIDGTDCQMAIDFGEIKITPLGLEKFHDCLTHMLVDELNSSIISPDLIDYTEYDENPNEGVIADTVEFINALAGYCKWTLYEKWFEGPQAKMIDQIHNFL